MNFLKTDGEKDDNEKLSMGGGTLCIAKAWQAGWKPCGFWGWDPCPVSSSGRVCSTAWRPAVVTGTYYVPCCFHYCHPS